MPLSPCALTLTSRCYKASWPTVDSNIVGLHALPTSVTFSVFYANLFPASLELFTIDLFMPKKRRYVSPYSSHLVLHLHPISQCSVADASGEVLPWIKEGTESRVILHCEVRGLWLKLPLHALLQLYCPSPRNYAKIGAVTTIFPPLNLPGNNWTGEARVSTCWKSDIFWLLIADPSFCCQLLKLIIISLSHVIEDYKTVSCLNIQYNLLILGSQRWCICFFLHAALFVACDLKMWKSRVDD